MNNQVSICAMVILLSVFFLSYIQIIVAFLKPRLGIVSCRPNYDAASTLGFWRWRSILMQCGSRHSLTELSVPFFFAPV